MNFSQITDHLFIGTTPAPEDYELLHSLGVRLVINMRIERPPFPDPHDPPMPVLWIPTFDSPFLPIPIRSLHRGAMAAIKVMENDGCVYTHCAAGVHRGVAVGASILIALGYTAEDAMRLIKERREVSDPHTWYIKRRILQFADQWKRQRLEQQRA